MEEVGGGGELQQGRRWGAAHMALQNGPRKRTGHGLFHRKLAERLAYRMSNMKLVIVFDA